MDDYDLSNEKITIEKDGKKVLCDIAFTFNCDDNGRIYVVCTDHSKTYNGAENFYAFYVDFFNSDGTLLEPVVTDEEMEMVNSAMNDFIKSVKEG